MTLFRKVRLEHLENRNMFAAFNIPWPEVNQLTLSFAPDGTTAGAQQTALFQTLDQTFGTREWQIEILRAFQTWAVESNINIGLVADQGNPIDTLGFKQGDPRFGDIRIGSFSTTNDVLAVANPYDPFIANTWVGDVFLNSNSAFIATASDPRGTLFTIMLHEAGHVYGIGHSVDPASAMYPQFQIVNSGLNSGDVSQVQALYGSRLGDDWEGTAGNNSLSTAAFVPFYDQSALLRAPSWTADLTTHQDVDYYQFTTPADTTSIDVDLVASGISLLTSKLSVLNSAGEVLASASSLDPRDNSLSLSIPAPQEGEQFFLKVEAVDDSVFGIGNYQLHVTPHSTVDAAEYHYTTDVEIDDADIHTLATTPGYVEHTYYEAYGSLSAAVPEQIFRVRSADLGPGLQNVFTVVLGAESALDQFIIELRDAAGNIVPYQRFQQADGTVGIQVLSVNSAADYFIHIRHTGSLTSHLDYELEVDFAQDGRHLQNYVNDQLTNAQAIVARVLDVRQSQHFHFVLGTSDWSQPQEAGLAMTITDASGRIVYTLYSADGEVRSGDVFLPRGEYAVEFSSPQRVPGQDIIFSLSGFVADSPIGPQLRDTVTAPVANQTASDSLTAFWLPARPLSQTIASVPSSSAVAAYGTLFLGNSSTKTAAFSSTAVSTWAGFVNAPRVTTALPMLTAWDTMLMAVTFEDPSDAIAADLVPMKAVEKPANSAAHTPETKPQQPAQATNEAMTSEEEPRVLEEQVFDVKPAGGEAPLFLPAEKPETEPEDNPTPFEECGIYTPSETQVPPVKYDSSHLAMIFAGAGSAILILGRRIKKRLGLLTSG